jgi:branched-chain amino acid transport system permease protein
MILFLVVISVGGTSTITGPFFASILLGVADVTGKYFIPSIGGFIIYTIMVVVLILRPQGLFVRGGSK